MLRKSDKKLLIFGYLLIWKSLGAVHIIVAGRMRPAKCLFKTPGVERPLVQQSFFQLYSSITKSQKM